MNRFIKTTSVCLCLLLASCASGPQQDGGQQPAAVQADPQAQAEFAQALLLAKRGQDDDAIVKFTSLSHKYPNLAGAFVNLGLLQLKKGRHEAARQALLQATTVNPRNAVAFNHLGVAHRALGEFQPARAAYEQALALDPQYAAAHRNLGILLDIYLGDLGAALTHYERYQALSGASDDEVEKWIVDLKRRADNTSQARGAP